MRTFSAFHPFVLMFYFIAVLLVTMFTMNPVLLCLALLSSISFHLVLGPVRDFRRGLVFCAGLFFAVALTNPLFSHKGITPLFYLNENPVTLEAVLYGVAIAAMLVAVLNWFQCYNRIMTSEKILFLFGRMIPKLSLLVSSALRFVPLFKQQAKKIQQTQTAMGLYAGDRYPDRLRGLLRVFSAVLTWSLENAVDTGDSMRARGYGLKGRSHFSLFRFTLRDGVFLGAIAALLAVVLAGLAAGETTFYFYPRVAAVSLTPLAIAAYLAFGILAFLPFLIELEENLKWNYYRSRI